MVYIIRSKAPLHLHIVFFGFSVWFFWSGNTDCGWSRVTRISRGKLRFLFCRDIGESICRYSVFSCDVTAAMLVG